MTDTMVSVPVHTLRGWRDTYLRQLAALDTRMEKLATEREEVQWAIDKIDKLLKDKEAT